MLTGTSNTYPYGQCTWWANQRFHDVQGQYVGWSGDAHSWASMALTAGWTVTSQPVQGPSIICLQPFIQGAGPLGHVAYVEAVQNANTVVTSNMNWGLTRYEQLSVQTVTFHTGIGVNFISIHGTSVPGTLTQSFPTTTASNPLDSLKQLTNLGGWLSNPIRPFKLIAGTLLVIIALVLLFYPDVQKVALKAAETGVFA